MAGRAIAAIRSAFADRQPVLVFLAGPNGAGKSTFFRNFLEPHLAGRLPYVNADEIGKALREAGVAGSGVDYDRLAFDETRRRSAIDEARPVIEGPRSGERRDVSPGRASSSVVGHPRNLRGNRSLLPDYARRAARGQEKPGRTSSPSRAPGTRTVRGRAPGR